MHNQSDIDFKQYVEFIQTNPQGLVFGPFSMDGTATFQDDIYSAFHAAWDALHSKRDPTEEWFLKWLATMPGCSSCSSWFLEYVRTNPPRFADWPRWTWEAHNAVNEKLDKPTFAWWDFMLMYRKDLMPQQAKICEFLAVTSLAPHRYERQSVCLDSWRKLGLSIVSVNSPAEIDAIGRDYTQVDNWLPASDPGCKTQRINRLLDVAAKEKCPILLINADIEIYGDQSRLQHLIGQRANAIGIRYNYDSHPGSASVEQWGLDAFVIYPEQIKKLSRVDFAVGKPMWDYWLPWELEGLGDCSWITEPYFFHRAHEVAWTQAECTSAHAVFNAQFGRIDWTHWRTSRPPY